MLARGGSDSAPAGKELPDEPISQEAASQTKAPASQDRDAGTQAVREYVTSLQAQGLPDATVRELVASRITAAYEPRRASVRSSSLRAGESAAMLQARLDRLNSEQGDLILQLVGRAEPSANDTSVGTAEQAPSGVPIELGKPPIMPASMASTPPDTAKTAVQLAEWEKQRNHFAQAIGGGKVDPSSPGYRQRWIGAQSDADQQFRLWFGDGAYVARQMQAQREAQLHQQPEGQK